MFFSRKKVKCKLKCEVLMYVVQFLQTFFSAKKVSELRRLSTTKQFFVAKIMQTKKLFSATLMS